MRSVPHITIAPAGRKHVAEPRLEPVLFLPAETTLLTNQHRGERWRMKLVKNVQRKWLAVRFECLLLSFVFAFTSPPPPPPFFIYIFFYCHGRVPSHNLKTGLFRPFCSVTEECQVTTLKLDCSPFLIVTGESQVTTLKLDCSPFLIVTGESQVTTLKLDSSFFLFLLMRVVWEIARFFSFFFFFFFFLQRKPCCCCCCCRMPSLLFFMSSRCFYAAIQIFTCDMSTTHIVCNSKRF